MWYSFSLTIFSSVYILHCKRFIYILSFITPYYSHYIIQEYRALYRQYLTTLLWFKMAFLIYLYSHHPTPLLGLIFLIPLFVSPIYFTSLKSQRYYSLYILISQFDLVTYIFIFNNRGQILCTFCCSF